MFIGRDYYLDILSALWRKNSSSLVVVSGRRRIGKSTLVEQFASLSKCRFIEIEGLAPDKGMTNEKQLANFTERLSRVTGLPEAKADTWPKAFDALDAAISKTARTIVFLDEISWMGAYDSSFAAYLKNAWDTQLSRKGSLILVLAGSVSAWIQDNILKSKGFVGRISLDITLPEMPLADCRAFWGQRAGQTALREILDELSVTGGIPKYLQEIDASLDADENIRRLCFLPEGYLFRDFNSIFSDVFGNATMKRSLLQLLAEGPATLSEMSQKLGQKVNGHISDELRDLTEAGFIAPGHGLNPETGAQVRQIQYRLKDNYTRFYLRFIAPREAAIRAGLFKFTSLENLPGWEAIMGLQFENLVLNNLDALCSLIGLEGRLITSAAPYARRKTATSPGLQIDLLIQTPKALYVIEIKRRKHISASIENEVQDKIRRLRAPRDKSVRSVLVYEGDLAPEVVENGYFDYIVPVERLLGR
ncbi:MAG: ATP-binding protein [Victivallales bacterium]|nr:ATP-binding protein [Victivallales bacterium]